MTLTQCLDVLRARRTLLLCVLLLMVCGALAASLWRPRLFTASASVLVDLRPDPLTSLAFSGGTSPSFKATQVDIIGSQPVLSRVAAMLPPQRRAALQQEWQQGRHSGLPFERWLSQQLADSLQVRPASDSQVITIAAQAHDPEEAAALANAFAKAYIDVALEVRTDPARQYSGFFEDRAQAARAALAQAQKKLGDFQAANGIVSNEERVDLETARLNQLSSQLTVLQSVAQESASRQAQAQGQRGDQLQEVVNHPLLGQLKAEIGRADAQLQLLATRQGDNHPQVIEARVQLAELRSRLDAESRRVSGSVGVNASIQRQRQAELGATLADQRSRVLKLKAVRDEGVLLQRDVEGAQRSYDNLRQRHAQSSLESQATQANIQLLSPAQAPLTHSSPNIGLNALLGLLLGGLSGTALALALELRDRRVRSAEDLAACTRLPLLAALPAAGKPGAETIEHSERIPPAKVVSPVVRVTPARLPRAPLPALGAGGAIGEILVGLGRLEDTQVRRVLEHQQAHGLHFGEAAQALGLVSQEDVLQALGRQFGYPLPGGSGGSRVAGDGDDGGNGGHSGAGGDRRLSPELVTLHDPFGRRAEHYRSLRSQLSLRIFARADRPAALAVVSPGVGDGRSVTAANLAVALAQLEGPTLLIDADLRAASQHKLFGLRAGSGLASLLAGRVDDRIIKPVAAMPGLFVLPAGPWAPNPLELVERPAFAALMRAMGQRFRHVVVDTPAAERGADAAVIASGCGAALVVARRHACRMDAMQALTDTLANTLTSALTANPAATSRATLPAGPALVGGTVLVEH